MLFFIGGAARTGKGILVRRLLAELGLPYLNLDVLKMGVARGMPEYALNPDAGAIRVAERLWPLVREMSVSLIRDGVDYVMEGEILPEHVALLRDTHPSQVKACFLGYGAMAPSEKLREIRAHAGHPNDWPQEIADTELLSIIAREIAFSQRLQAECVRYRFPYFDTSHRFMPAMDEVVAYIRGI